MEQKSVVRTLFGQEINVEDVPVLQPFPTQSVQRIDPFLLLHDVRWEVPKDYPVKITGVGPHPHRGFVSVTLVYKGGVRHRDSRGNDATVAAGGVQWLHAGMGIVHSERAADEMVAKGGEIHLLQVWINLPAKEKLSQPYYKALSANDLPIVESSKLDTVQLVAGNYGEVKSPVITASNLLILKLSFLQANVMRTLTIPNGFSCFVYVVSGEVKAKGFGLVQAQTGVVFSEEGEQITIESLSQAEVLVLSGKPLNEKVEQYGPYVMNTQTEILQAMRDYQMGKMGILIED